MSKPGSETERLQGNPPGAAVAERDRAPDQPSRGTGVVSFSGHETFTLRHGWLKKAVDAVQSDPQVFMKDTAMVELGVGKNMVRSIRHWALAANVVSEVLGTRGAELSTTSLGGLVFGPHGYDAFLEDLNTLWLIHWQLATNERRGTGWCWMFNLLRSDEFTRESLFELFTSELKRRNIAGPSISSLRRDIDCAIRTYVGARTKRDLLEESLECPLVELQLISSDPDGILFRFSRGPKPSLSDRVFLHCLLEFWAARSSQDSLAFSEIAFANASPGSVFKLDENSIAVRLERLESVTNGALIYDETAGLKQVYRRRNVDGRDCLSRHYQESLALIGE
jgi:Protein of unknown function (DUF4007)